MGANVATDMVEYTYQRLISTSILFVLTTGHEA